MNPYDEFKQKQGLVKYVCNKCKNSMENVYFDATSKGVDSIMGMLGSNKQTTPDAFYCKNNRCDRFGLLTKVAIKQ